MTRQRHRKERQIQTQVSGYRDRQREKQRQRRGEKETEFGKRRTGKQVEIAIHTYRVRFIIRLNQKQT